ncbi:crossover junction endodeoxyribonuclease RuvC [Coralloluteibacterium stylophorae]|uniref:Crossover junction endodeoxyribonuclease RuvC n=1 Tax=Coralloluteibacterium stylophorae TaxID=1776034 RepID=A0A8J7VU95_9GAMM|nr:crossover junction endodeoxyribonuclease RuvC [Coralloluteibacterium stylophorae]MBS7456780.1 crossover junction endodeoxyribonuclease RuvC [Coralloluteibacterium stylophorae]
MAAIATSSSRPAGSVRVLGIDPGSVRTGVGIVDADALGRPLHVFHCALAVGGEDDFPARLRAIFDGVNALIDAHAPDEVAIERVFVSRNPDSALKLGQARGAAIVAAASRGLKVHEYAPMQIKNAVVGRGAAEKAQVQHMVGVLLGVDGRLQADAADALAVAITHAHSRLLAERTGVLASALLRRRGRR